MAKTGLKIYLIKPFLPSRMPKVYESAVVAAWSPKDAKTLHPGNLPYWDLNTWAPSSACVTATFVGTAGANVKRGVINASYFSG